MIIVYIIYIGYSQVFTKSISMIDFYFYLFYNFYGDDYMDIFCKIINKEVSSNILYEDELVIAIMDVNPRSNGHTLVIPKKHYNDIYDVDNNTLMHMWDVARDINNLIVKKLHSNGLTYEINYGICQEVKHIHLHIIPRYKYEDIVDYNEIYKVLMSK